VSGSAKLFPQHCQVPNLSNTAHLKALTKELITETVIAAKTHKGRTFIQKLKIAIDDLLTADMGSKQRVGTNSVAVLPQIMVQVGRPIKRITMAPPMIKTRDPIAKRNLIKRIKEKQGTTHLMPYLQSQETYQWLSPQIPNCRVQGDNRREYARRQGTQR
jgi:hypothetical protein